MFTLLFLLSCDDTKSNEFKVEITGTNVDYCGMMSDFQYIRNNVEVCTIAQNR